jgi:outer membrane biosynthesis protein TonB
MEAETVQDAPATQELERQLAQSRARLEELSGDLAAVDAELESLALERRQHNLLREACRALDDLQEAGAANLFWDGFAPEEAREAQLRRARGRVQAFQFRVGEIEGRRRGLVEQIGDQHEQHFVLEDEAFEAQEEEEKRRAEWIVERELDAARSHPHLMPWARGQEDDRRFRKTAGIALLVCVLIALLAVFVVLPAKLLPPEQPLPERVVTVIPELRKLEKAPPPPPQMKPLEQKRKPVEKPQPQQAPAEAPQAEAPAPDQGLLAFRDKLKVKDVPSNAQLGKAARINTDNASAKPERSMLTSNVPGSSGGIELSSTSRNFGRNGGSERGAIQGAALTRAASGIGAGAPAARPLSGGPGLSRTDEEIQIVFDQHKASLYRLYNRELRRDPTLQGKIILRLTIQPDGSVSMCQVQSTEINAPELAAQVAERVRGFNFGAKDVPAVTIVYPIDFLPAS